MCQAHSVALYTVLEGYSISDFAHLCLNRK